MHSNGTLTSSYPAGLQNLGEDNITYGMLGYPSEISTLKSLILPSVEDVRTFRRFRQVGVDAR